MCHILYSPFCTNYFAAKKDRVAKGIFIVPVINNKDILLILYSILNENPFSKAHPLATDCRFKENIHVNLRNN